jgi:hypothetical protein
MLLLTFYAGPYPQQLPSMPSREASCIWATIKLWFWPILCELNDYVKEQHKGQAHHHLPFLSL